MIKNFLFITGSLLIYQFIAATLLYTSSYLNIVSYYTHPPSRGEIGFRRLPLLFGDSISIAFLNMKTAEASKLVAAGEIGMAAVLSSYTHNNFLTKTEAKHRAIIVAELFIKSGYDVSNCEADGRSTARILEEWGFFEPDIKKFLLQHIESDELTWCNK